MKYTSKIILIVNCLVLLDDFDQINSYYNFNKTKVLINKDVKT